MAAPVDMNPSYDMGMPVEMGTPMDMGSPVEMPMEGTIVDDAMMAVPMTDNVEQSYDQNVEQGTVIESSSPAPIEETVEQPEQPFDSAAETAPPVPSEPESTAAEPVADPTTDSDDDDLFGGSSDDMSADPVPADEPADDMNTDDLFGGSDDPAPTQPSDSFDDDLFGGPSDGAPVEAEGSMDDLFGSPPADAPAEEPAGGMDDLFGDPPADTNDAMPNSDEQPSIDDLFGDASSQNDSDIESMVSQETSVDDLFGTAESTEVTSDELFDAPSQDASQDTDADFNIDDLFGATTPPSVKVTEESPVAVEEAAVQVVSKSVMPTDVLGENRIRTWIDNTGVYHVEGRLIEIAGDHVRLLKANGRTCTVPNSRLCQADAAYVDSIREQADSSRLAMLTSK